MCVDQLMNQSYGDSGHENDVVVTYQSVENLSLSVFV